MDLITPDIGLLFWTLLSFTIVLLILRAKAWKPITKALRDRETSIDEALGLARKAREEIAQLQAKNEDLLKDAREERDAIMKEAREAKSQIIAEAKQKAKEEASKEIASARETIKNEKLAAISELKNQVATLSIDIAEKIVREQLSSDAKQKALVENLIEEVNMN